MNLISMEDQEIRNEGNIIEWLHKGEIHRAEVTYVDMDEQCYYVYCNYAGGQDMIPFDKIL